MRKRKSLIWSDYLIALGVALIGIGFITQSSAVSLGVQNGLKICAGVLIPALFPFMVLSGFLSVTNAAKILSLPLTPVTTRIFKLPREFGAIILLSLIGGYPVGAKCISILLEQKKIERVTAERMLCFCVNSGPSFLITAVGVGMLHNRAAGIILFFTQTAATLIIGAVTSFRAKMHTAINRGAKMRGAEALVTSVSGASSAIIAMCSYAVLFSGVLSMISASGIAEAVSVALNIDESVVSAIINGFFEVTSGCISAAGIQGASGFALISAIVSFGGISVLFQIMSCFRDCPVSFRPLILSRVCHMLLSVIMSSPLYQFFCEAKTAFAPSARPVIYMNSRMLLISVSLLCMCAILTLHGKNTNC